MLIQFEKFIFLSTSETSLTQAPTFAVQLIFFFLMFQDFGEYVSANVLGTRVILCKM